MTRPSGNDTQRRLNRDEDQRTPEREGQPPRPATEPPGSEGSTQTPHTETDPATGEPSPRR